MKENNIRSAGVTPVSQHGLSRRKKNKMVTYYWLCVTVGYDHDRETCLFHFSFFQFIFSNGADATGPFVNISWRPNSGKCPAKCSIHND